MADESDAREAVKLAIDLGGDVNAANRAGNTALYSSSAVSKSSRRLRCGTSYRRAVVRSYNKRESAEQRMEGIKKDENGHNKWRRLGV
jgi:hypothetical protein